MSEDAKEWQEGLRRYLKWVEGQHSTMRLLGQPRPVPLEGIFTDVYVLDRPSASCWMGIEELQRQYRARERRPVVKRYIGMEMVRRELRLFILGKPGAGKTTFLKYVALQAAREKPTKRVPVFISLKALADSGQDILTFMVEQVAHGEFTNAEGFVKKLLKAGRALVLLDGLDEAQQHDFDMDNLLRDVNRLTSRYPESQYLVTCRLAAMEYQFERFTYVEMADFTQPQIESFVGKWFAADAAQGKCFLEELAKPDHRGLQELAQVPLLLTLLCLAFEETLSFPQRRVEVYNEAVEALLKRWDATRGIRRDEVYKHLSYDRKRQMLARLAFDTFESGHYFIPQADLEAKIVEWLRQLPTTEPNEELDGGAILKAIEAQHGLFVERARQIYSFAHLSFQEYFTAKYIVEMGGILPFLMTKVTELRWREVFLLVASLLPNANRFFDSFLTALDGLVTDHPPIVELLEWAEGMADAARGYSSREALRSFYLDLALALVDVASLDLTDSERHLQASQLGFAHARSSTLTSALNLMISHNQYRALPLALDHASNLARVCARNQERKVAPDLIRAFNRVLRHIKKLSEQTGQTNIYTVLESLIIPETDASPKAWQLLANTLDDLLSTEFQPTSNWTLELEPGNHLITYLDSTLLLLDCLAVAIVSDREGIKARLLRPPTPKTKPPAPGGTEG